MTNPLVTIGVPTFNRAEQLRAAINSCLAQTHAPLEVLISDNASTDATASICAEFAKRDPRVRVIRQATNLGSEENYRTVLREASGELFAWLADDDHLAADYVEKCAALLVGNAEAVMAGGSVEYFRGVEQLFLERLAPEMASPDVAVRIGAYFTGVGLSGELYALMRRDSALRAVLPDTLGGDWLFVAQMLAQGKALAVPGATLTRSLNGSSSDMRALAERFGLNPRWGEHRHLWILARLVAFLVRGSGSFASLDAASRARMTQAAGSALFPRWWFAAGRRSVGLHWLGRTRASALERLRA